MEEGLTDERLTDERLMVFSHSPIIDFFNVARTVVAINSDIVYVLNSYNKHFSISLLYFNSLKSFLALKSLLFNFKCKKENEVRKYRKK